MNQKIEFSQFINNQKQLREQTGKLTADTVERVWGDMEEFPRLLDVGQCNDAYAAVQVALALAEALGCTVNDLPLSLVLSWYEQKAVAILLTLLALGVKNIRLGPSLPAFVTPDILNLLVSKWNITPISTPEEDLHALSA